MGPRAAIESLLNAELPADASEICYARVQPSSDLAFFTAFARFKTSPQGFAELVSRAGLDPHGTGTALAILPTSWRWTEFEPPWWDAGSETPGESAAKPTAYNGWIAMKYEGGFAYVIVTDTGQSPPPP